MIMICPRSNRCKNYKHKEPCWTESTKGQTTYCDDYEGIQNE